MEGQTQPARVDWVDCLVKQPASNRDRPSSLLGSAFAIRSYREVWGRNFGYFDPISDICELYRINLYGMSRVREEALMVIFIRKGKSSIEALAW